MYKVQMKNFISKNQHDRSHSCAFTFFPLSSTNINISYAHSDKEIHCYYIFRAFPYHTEGVSSPQSVIREVTFRRSLSRQNEEMARPAAVRARRLAVRTRPRWRRRGWVVRAVAWTPDRVAPVPIADRPTGAASCIAAAAIAPASSDSGCRRLIAATPCDPARR